MIIGRKEEIADLESAYRSEESEFVVVYGRRRIGKTYLVGKVFKNNYTFQYTGIYDIPNQDQLTEFHTSLINQGLPKDKPAPKTWFEAFHLLAELVTLSKDQRKVIFIDELAWMDARNSHFVAAFEHFWNGWAAARNDILLVVCASASSWIIKKIFRNKGGLYNRASYKIRLTQFSLAECEALVESRKLPLTRKMIIDGYMVMGGVPYYWSKLKPTKSLSQNINDLIFRTSGELHNEFTYIYSSMFSNPGKYIKVVEALAGKKSGLTRDEIIEKGDLDSSGQLSEILDDLIECGLIRKYCHLDKKQKDALYQLVDCFTLFYYSFVNGNYEIDDDYWMKLQGSSTYNTWCGLAFERVCLLHTRQIKAAIGISGIMANLFSWHIKKTDYHPGVQIDLIIDRADDIMNICEMKYAPDGYALSAKEIEKLRIRVGVLRQYISQKKYLQQLLITSSRIIPNKYSGEIPLQVYGDQLFLP